MKKISVQDLEIWRQYTRDIKIINNKKRIYEYFNYNRSIQTREQYEIDRPLEEDTLSLACDEIVYPLSRGEFHYLNRKQLKTINKNDDFRILDLHGFNLKEAEYEFENFLKLSFINNERNLKIITGKGTVEFPSIIKENILKWIKKKHNLTLIIFYDYYHNNSGMLQIILKNHQKNLL